VTPRGGFNAALPCSAALLALNGMAAASASVSLILSTSASPLTPTLLPREGPLTVERALVVAPEAPGLDEEPRFLAGRADFLVGIETPCVSQEEKPNASHVRRHGHSHETMAISSGQALQARCVSATQVLAGRSTFDALAAPALELTERPRPEHRIASKEEAARCAVLRTHCLQCRLGHN
jgi:hypothetical protein